MRRALAIVVGFLSVFFAFYTVRLLAVTSFLTHTRVGGGGAFVGAVVFPLLMLLFAWTAVRIWRGAKPSTASLSNDH
jgi:hypothetical protein